jgi:hypothetical protein
MAKLGKCKYHFFATLASAMVELKLINKEDMKQEEAVAECKFTSLFSKLCSKSLFESLFSFLFAFLFETLFEKFVRKVCSKRLFEKFVRKVCSKSLFEKFVRNFLRSVGSKVYLNPARA